MKNVENSNRVFIWGKNPSIEALKAKKRAVHKVFIQKSRRKEYIKYANRNDVAYELLDKGQMHNLIQRPDHQGIIISTQPYPYVDFNIVTHLEAGYIVIAEGVTDPQNLGSMIRSAFILGAKAFVIPSKYSASITPVVTHTSAGATEYIDIAKVKSLHHGMRELQKRDFSIVAAAKPSGKTEDIREIQLPVRVALLLGSEGYGIKKSTLKICDKLASIPQKGNLDSFSVSAACAIMSFVVAGKLKIY